MLKQELLNFLFPNFCAHCSVPIGSYPLCDSCVTLLELIDPSERCKTCYAECSGRICNRCLTHEIPLDRMAAVFDYMGPAPSLVKKMKYGNQPWHAETIAPWMTHYLLANLRWPAPDLIIPAPMVWNKKLTRGYNQSLLIAEAIGAYLNVPVHDVLRRRIGDPSQARLSKERRSQLAGESFFVKKAETLYDRSLLIVDDVMTTGTTLRCCAETLLEGCPASIHALAFCCAKERL